jgi:acetyltransferase-like isoleucine patch superfamily enzyme
MRKIIINVFNFMIAFKNYLVFGYLINIPLHWVRIILVRLNVKKIGINCSILRGLEIRVGNNVLISNNCVINKKVLLDGRGGKIVIGNNVDIGQETNIWTLEHDVNDDMHQVKGGNVVIEDYVWIASRVTILPGVTIGKGAVVACNSVVTKNVLPNDIVGGIPAKTIGTRKNNFKYTLYHRPWFE